MEVAYGGPPRVALTPPLIHWLGVIGGVVFSSVHNQDLYDQAGDSIWGRRPLPLVIEDGPSRLVTAGSVIFWSYYGCHYWQAHLSTGILVMVLGAAVLCRTMTLSSVSEDKPTFKLWNVRLVALYFVPLFKSISKGGRFA